MIDLQDITISMYKLLLLTLPGMTVYNSIAAYDRESPYAVFDLVEGGARGGAGHDYFGDDPGTDHVFVLSVKLYASRDEGAGALRRSAARMISALHRTRPTLTGLSASEIRVRQRGNTVHAGNNLWMINPVFSIVGSATS